MAPNPTSWNNLYAHECDHFSLQPVKEDVFICFSCKHRSRGTLAVLYTMAHEAINLSCHEPWSTIMYVPQDVSLIRKIKLYIEEQNERDVIHFKSSIGFPHFLPLCLVEPWGERN